MIEFSLLCVFVGGVNGKLSLYWINCHRFVTEILTRSIVYSYIIKEFWSGIIYCCLRVSYYLFSYVFLFPVLPFVTISCKFYMFVVIKHLCTWYQMSSSLYFMVTMLRWKSVENRVKQWNSNNMIHKLQYLFIQYFKLQFSLLLPAIPNDFYSTDRLRILSCLK